MAESIALTSPLPRVISARSPASHGRELFWNHVWESLNAGAKIFFFAIVTPMMLAAWGRDQFGLFAVANSVVALMAFFDLGLRTLTRIGLTSSQLDEQTKLKLHASNFAAFCFAAAAAVIVAALLSVIGFWHRALHLPRVGDFIITATAALTAVLMALQLLVERIAAAHQLSRVKIALFVGNVAAIIAVVILLNRGASVALVTTTYFTVLAFPLLFLLPLAQLRPCEFLAAITTLRPGDVVAAITSGGWINLITASWIFQSYSLVLLISWVAGPAAAGTFFLYLKLSEVLSVLGASANEPTIAAVAAAPTAQDRHRHFATGYKSAVVLGLGGAAVYAFFSDDLFRIWLHRPLGLFTGLFIGLFGFAGGFIRMVVSASLGLNKPRPAALGLFVGALVCAGLVIALQQRATPELIIAIGCIGAIAMQRAARSIAPDLGQTFSCLWLYPLLDFAPTLFVIVIVCAVASRIGNLIAAGLAVAIALALCARHIFRSSPSRADALLGYDTRSWRSAIVMKIVDVAWPWRRIEPFAWANPCVVSSIAGLGDLFIHLPLIAGIVNEARNHGIHVRVALRPAHLEIGRLCGWDVFPFDNTLEDFFKNPTALTLPQLGRQIESVRHRKAKLWIDLSGSAISAVAIKLAGVRKIAMRITRGGRSLVNHPLPHTIHENEYENLERVATAIGCQLDHTVFDKLRCASPPEFQNAVVLCLTTICRWRNWPIQNFLALVDEFPDVHFVGTGFRAEVVPPDQPALDDLLGRPNVTSRMDETSILQLIQLIAHARAVVTNDTSTAHIANGFHKPGAVIFGPASSDKLSAPNGLKPFGDRTCPFHPCVQWTCANQANWCMRKTGIAPVAAHLAEVLSTRERYAAAASVG